MFTLGFEKIAVSAGWIGKHVGGGLATRSGQLMGGQVHRSAQKIGEKAHKESGEFHGAIKKLLPDLGKKTKHSPQAASKELAGMKKSFTAAMERKA